ncbi:hypothetical protein [Methanolobus sp. WCC4]|uniref:hypothetical protein n=1 Tax=Methanolobus sp. WCC4 TaxID=3125784 RepID=UPI0030FB1C46
MKYIHFVIVCICLLVLCISPVAGVRTEAMMHYSEPAVAVGDEVILEQGYSFKVVDMNTKSGAVMIELYLDGDELDLEDSFAKEAEPLEHIRSVTEEEDDETDEVEYLILRITAKGSVKEYGDVYRSTVYIEQYLDPLEDVDDYLILDNNYYFDDDSELELAELYTLGIMDVDDSEISLELRLDGELLKQDDVEEGDYFYYTVYSDEQPDVVFLANVDAFIESDDVTTVFLKHVSLKQVSISDQDDVSSDDDVPDEVDIDVDSPVDGGLKAGRIAIITYYVDDAFSEVRILIDDDMIDSRNDVSAGAYKAVTDELSAGVHKATLIMVDDDGGITSHSEEFSVSVDIKDNITESISGFASSAVEGLGKDDNASDNVSSSLSLPSLPSGSGISNVISFIITAGVFVVFFMFFRKFR